MIPHKKLIFYNKILFYLCNNFHLNENAGYFLLKNKNKSALKLIDIPNYV